jgi:serine/threonine protein kinase
MGKVYRGQEVQTDTPVAIKLLKPEMVDAEMIERFTREGEILRRLNHPNIVKLLATAEEGPGSAGAARAFAH